MSCSSAASANRVRIAYAPESAFAVAPVTPVMKVLRWTSESLKQDTTTTQSNEVRDDRQISDIKRTSIGTSGPINIELSYGTFDDLFQAVLYSAGWSTPQSVVSNSTISFTAPATIAGTGLFASFAADQWIRISGSANNDGFYKITAASANSLTVEGGITTEAAGASITIVMGAQIVNGVDCQSFVIEKSYQDLTNEHALFLGQIFNGMSLSAAVNQNITGSFTLIGAREESTNAELGSSYTAAPTNDVMGPIDEIAGIYEGGVAKSAREFSFTVANNARQQMVLGNLGPTGLGSGTMDVTGSLRCYFETKTLLDKYLNFSDSSIALALQDTAGNGYVFDFPRVKFTDGQRVAGGVNTDIIADLSFMAKMHPTELVTMRIARFPAS